MAAVEPLKGLPLECLVPPALLRRARPLQCHPHRQGDDSRIKPTSSARCKLRVLDLCSGSCTLMDALHRCMPTIRCVFEYVAYVRFDPAPPSFPRSPDPCDPSRASGLFRVGLDRGYRRATSAPSRMISRIVQDADSFRGSLHRLHALQRPHTSEHAPQLRSTFCPQTVPFRRYFWEGGGRCGGTWRLIHTVSKVYA